MDQADTRSINDKERTLGQDTPPGMRLDDNYTISAVAPAPQLSVSGQARALTGPSLPATTN